MFGKRWDGLLSFPQTAPIDDVEKSSVSYTVLTCSRQDLRNKKEEENLAESIGGVPAKYLPKVKLENFNHSRVLELG